jgi:hypothetical protein
VQGAFCPPPKKIGDGSKKDGMGSVIVFMLSPHAGLCCLER